MFVHEAMKNVEGIIHVTYKMANTFSASVEMLW